MYNIIYNIYKYTYLTFRISATEISNGLMGVTGQLSVSINFDCLNRTL